MGWGNKSLFIMSGLYVLMPELVKMNTVNPLYTDTRYDDKICYNDNLNVK